MTGRTERLADVVGLVTLGFGAALTVAPRRSATALGLGVRPGFAAVVGVTDLVVGAGLLRGRHRRRWMTARAALNLVLAARYAADAGRDHRARAGAVAMGSLTVVDAALAVALGGRTPRA